MPLRKARDILAEKISYVGSVPSESMPYTCPICLGPLRLDFEQCYSCHQLFDLDGAPASLIGQVVPMSTALNPSAWYSCFTGYKGLARGYSQYLAALFASYLGEHQSRIETMLGGDWTMITIVPSTRGISYDDQPLKKALWLATGIREYLHQTLSHVSGRSVSRGSFDPSAFESAGEEAAGHRVLLIEDLWVSGAKCVSAAGRLLDDGAESVAILPIAREFRDNPDFTPPDYLAASEAPFDISFWPRSS